MNDELCPCGSGNLYLTCCQPYLTGGDHPSSPEQLMRSRYTAFCKGDVDYLLATHHPSKRQVGDRQTLTKTIAETTWLGLRVLHSNTPATGTGSVEFVAFFQSKGTPGQLHEKSEFICQNDRWYYLQGVILGPITTGRNDACWCGSGKKYKKCHGA
jgi:SEC-C motif domain protein